MVSAGQELRSGLSGQFWLRVSHEESDTVWACGHLNSSLGGARISKRTHTYSSQNDAGCWKVTSVSLYVSFFREAIGCPYDIMSSFCQREQPRRPRQKFQCLIFPSLGIIQYYLHSILQVTELSPYLHCAILLYSVEDFQEH